MCYIGGCRFLMRPVFAHADTSRCRIWIVLGWCAALLTIAQPVSAQSLRIVPLVRPDQVYVSMEMADGFTDEVRAAIKSGLKTTYTYSVELRLDVPIGWDRTIGTSTITSSVEYDTLKRLYTVVRMVDGKVNDSNSLEDENAVRRWMTSLVRLPLFSTSVLEPNREYYIRISATARPSNGSILWPFGSGTSAQAKFTFIR